jgi:hypothetical protein
LKEQVPSHVHLHARALYDSLEREEAKVLVQLRTGMSRLKGFMGDIYRFAKQTLICLATEEVTRTTKGCCAQQTGMHICCGSTA